MTTIPKSERDRLRAMADAATPGEWSTRLDRHEQENVYSGDAWIALLPHQCITSIERQSRADAAFIAAARTAIPALLDALDQRDRLLAECARWLRAYDYDEKGDAAYSDHLAEVIENVLAKEPT